MSPFEPNIIGFLCHWCAYEGADAAGRARKEYPSHFRPIHVMCSGRVDPQFVLQAFRDGADGVMILGCHPGECHYKEGNVTAAKRFLILQRLVKSLGIEEERLALHWISAGEQDRFVRVVEEMTETVKRLGPLGRQAFSHGVDQAGEGLNRDLG